MERGAIGALSVLLSSSPLLASLVALFAMPATVDHQGTVAVVAVLAVALMSFALLYGRDIAFLVTASTTGPIADERCLRGSFRRQSSPDTPGRPRPRAPGQGRRPA